jgi:hypothetical protein
MSLPPQYVIDHTKRQARKLGVKVKHSTRKKRKITCSTKTVRNSLRRIPGYALITPYIKSRQEIRKHPQEIITRTATSGTDHVEGTAGFSQTNFFGI